MITTINSEDRLVQQTFAEHLENVLGWESIYAYNTETFGPQGTLGRASEREALLVRDLFFWGRTKPNAYQSRNRTVPAAFAANFFT